jgi:hypothetical protein
MTDPELDLTPEELALLAQSEQGVEVAPVAELEPPAQELDQDIKPKRRGRKPAAPFEPDMTPAPEPTFVPEPVLEPEPALEVDDALARAADDAERELLDQRAGQAIADALAASAVIAEGEARYVPGPEHSHVPPAQMSYGDDPWGLLPTNMRHDPTGRHCP